MNYFSLNNLQDVFKTILQLNVLRNANELFANQHIHPQKPQEKQMPKIEIGNIEDFNISDHPAMEAFLDRATINPKLPPVTKSELIGMVTVACEMFLPPHDWTIKVKNYHWDGSEWLPKQQYSSKYKIKKKFMSYAKK